MKLMHCTRALQMRGPAPNPSYMDSPADQLQVLAELLFKHRQSWRIDAVCPKVGSLLVFARVDIRQLAVATRLER